MEDGDLELPLPEKKTNVRETQTIYLPPLNVPKPKNVLTLDDTENFMWAEHDSSITKSPKSHQAAQFLTNCDSKAAENFTLQQTRFAQQNNQYLDSQQTPQLPKLAERLAQEEEEETFEPLVLQMFEEIRSLEKITPEVDFIVESHKHDTRLTEYGKKRRQRLNEQQEAVLELEFQKNMDWSIEKQKQLARRLEMSMSKVYKWCWDRKKRFKTEASELNNF